jgi:hypothetical protein
MTSLKSFDADGLQFAWDATSLSSFAKCPRYYAYKHLEGWTHPNKSVHLVFGGLYATALEHYFKHRASGVDHESALRSIVHEALIETWEHERDEDGSRIPGTGKPWDSLHNTKTRETLIRTIVWYFEQFAEDTTSTVHLADGSPAVELSFALPVDDGLVYCGHIDRLVTYGEHAYVMDQKTSGATLSKNFADQFSVDYQMSGYSYAGKVILDSPVSGVIIDAAQIAVGFSRFERFFVHKPDALLNEWYDIMLATASAARSATREQRFIPNFASCGNYGGCEFRKICSRSPEHRQRALDAEFVRRPRWDPLEQR